MNKFMVYKNSKMKFKIYNIVILFLFCWVCIYEIRKKMLKKGV